MQITYQKNDGCIFQKYRNTVLPYKIGERTSMGWIVLNIKYEYEGNYYSENEYYALIKNKKQKTIKKKQKKQLYMNELKKFTYYFIAAFIMKIISILIGI